MDEYHEYEPTEEVGQPCAVCGFDRHNPLHGPRPTAPRTRKGEFPFPAA